MYFHFTIVMSYKTISKIANMEKYGMEERHHFRKPSTRVNDFWFSNFVFHYFKVPTVFWWDNFDRKISRLSGGGTINTTPGIAFRKLLRVPGQKNLQSILKRANVDLFFSENQLL